MENDNVVLTIWREDVLGTSGMCGRTETSKEPCLPLLSKCLILCMQTKLLLYKIYIPSQALAHLRHYFLSFHNHGFAWALSLPRVCISKTFSYLTSYAVTRPKLVVIQQEMYRGGMKACKYYTRSIYRFITMLSKGINILITAEQLL